MKYLGSKAKIAKELVPIILRDRGSRWVVEPFCGGCNMTKYWGFNAIAGDANHYLIEMWKAVQDGWLPPEELSFSDWTHIRANKGCYDDALVAFAGFCCSFGSDWFTSYARGRCNYALDGHRALLSKRKFIQEVIFLHMSFEAVPTPPGSIIYCDPPYAGFKGYDGVGDFDRECFWQWCRTKKAEGHTVFVSEYKAPEDFKCVWVGEEKKSLLSIESRKYNSGRTERLFTL
jgi:DNA adenine methylase